MQTSEDPYQQRERIIRAVKQLDSSASVEFDDNAGPNFIRFRIVRGSVFLTKVFPSYHCSELCDKSDDQIKALLISLSGGLL